MTLKRTVSIRGMYGLDDYIYQRAFVCHFPGALWYAAENSKSL